MNLSYERKIYMKYFAQSVIPSVARNLISGDKFDNHIIIIRKRK